MAVKETVHSTGSNGCHPRTAQPGDLVKIKNLESGKEVEITLVDNPAHKPGPANKALLGRQVGNVVDIPLRDRLVKHLIRKIETP